MKLINAQFDWMEGWGNLPKIKLQFTPDTKDWINDVVYDNINGNHIAVHPCGLVDSLYWVCPGDGFGGRVFKVKMRDGSIKELKGPWHSNSVAITKETKIEVEDISYTYDADTWKRGYTFYFGFCTHELYLKAFIYACRNEPLGDKYRLVKSKLFGWFPDKIINGESFCEKTKRLDTKDIEILTYEKVYKLAPI